MPLSVSRWTGMPTARTFGALPPGKVEATIVQGFEFVLGTTGQPRIGAPIRSVSRITIPPWIDTVVCLGISCTWPPCAQMIRALDVTTKGMLRILSF